MTGGGDGDYRVSGVYRMPVGRYYRQPLPLPWVFRAGYANRKQPGAGCTKRYEPVGRRCRFQLPQCVCFHLHIQRVKFAGKNNIYRHRVCFTGWCDQPSVWILQIPTGRSHGIPSRDYSPSDPTNGPDGWPGHHAATLDVWLPGVLAACDCGAR